MRQRECGPQESRFLTRRRGFGMTAAACRDELRKGALGTRIGATRPTSCYFVRRKKMKARGIVLGLAVCLFTVAVCLAADLFAGTWKLNEAKSKLAAGQKNTTVIYEAMGDEVKVTVEGVDAEGKATHNEWTGKFDGKDYPVTGDATSDSRAYMKVNDHTLTFTAKKDGKETLTGRIAVSKDGKTRTVTTTATDASGKKVSSTAVYEKQ